MFKTEFMNIHRVVISQEKNVNIMSNNGTNKYINK
jgi:hypothetical protein